MVIEFGRRAFRNRWCEVCFQTVEFVSCFTVAECKWMTSPPRFQDAFWGLRIVGSRIQYACKMAFNSELKPFEYKYKVSQSALDKAAKV